MSLHARREAKRFSPERSGYDPGSSTVPPGLQILPDAAKMARAGSDALYKDGTYLQKNPSWHVDESPWKAEQILRLISRHKMTPNTVCEIGCGAGEVLRQLQPKLAVDCVLCGYEISPQAYELCQTRSNDKLSFKLMDIRHESRDITFDLVLILDVIEHLEDYFSFLRDVRFRGRFTICHIPLDLSTQTVLRKNGLMKRRDMYAHLHYFTKDIALQILRDVGYEIIDFCYTPRSNDLGWEPIQRLLRLPRTVGFALHKDLTVRTLGGYSLLVLAK